MVTSQSANQLKTPAKVSWAFKMVSQFGSLGYTIMGKTADLTVVQKTNIDTLHKEGKTQTFISKEAGCSQSAVSKHVNRRLSGRKKCGRKRCTTNRENRSFMRIVKQNQFKNLGELHKEWTEAGVKASRAPHTDVSRNLSTVVVRGVLPGLRRRTGLLPSGPKSSFQMRASFVETKDLESGGRVEKLIAQVAWSPVLSFHSLWWFGCNVICCVGPLCFLKTNVTAPVYQDILEHFMLPSADQLFKDADFIPAGFGSCPHCQKHQKLVKWPWCRCAWLVSKLTRPEPQRESMLYCQEENEKLIPPQQCHKLITSMPRWIEAVIKAKGAPTKYWVHIQ